MNIHLSFSVCRVCLVPVGFGVLSSLFDENAEIAVKFQNVSGIDVSWNFSIFFVFRFNRCVSQIFKDKNKHEALICDGCEKKLNDAFVFQEQMRSSEYNYFDTLRNEMEIDELINEENENVKEQIETVDGNESEVETTDEAEDSVQDRMKIDEEEKMEVPVKLIVELNTKKPYECSICHKSFRFKQNLKTHVESIHEKKTRFSCQHCPKTFYQKVNLKNHVASKHTFDDDDTSNKQRPFECATCQMRFKSKAYLNKHQLAHSGKFCSIKCFL
jgi:Zinc finger, C2H2 type/Zinc-finger of C2H2 type